MSVASGQADIGLGLRPAPPRAGPEFRARHFEEFDIVLGEDAFRVAAIVVPGLAGASLAAAPPRQTYPPGQDQDPSGPWVWTGQAPACKAMYACVLAALTWPDSCPYAGRYRCRLLLMRHAYGTVILAIGTLLICCHLGS